MKSRTKKWLIAATVLVVLGLLLFAAVMTLNHWDFTRLGTVSYATNTHTVRELFHKISLETKTADILFVPSDDGTCKVVCFEPENAIHSVSVSDDTLMICVNHQRPWYENINFAATSPKITVSLPQSNYESLMITGSTGNIELPEQFRFQSMDIAISTGDILSSASASGAMRLRTSTGDISVSDASAGTMELSATTGAITLSHVNSAGKVDLCVSTGKTRLDDVTCQTLVSSGSTGDLSLDAVMVQGDLSIERSTGDVNILESDAANISVRTTTGDITGALLTDKVFLAHTDTGRIQVPETISGGKCEIRTDTGDITFAP